MNDSVVSVEGQAARLIAAQFLGQQIGDLNEIGKMITSSTAHLKTQKPDAMGIINTIPITDIPQSITPVQPPVQPIVGQVVFNEIPRVSQPTQELMYKEKVVPKKAEIDQFEFNFTYDMASDLVERQKRIEKSINQLQKSVDYLLTNLKPSALKKS